MSPDYHERTRLQGVANWLGQIAWITVPWFYAIMYNKTLFDNPVEGARSFGDCGWNIYYFRRNSACHFHP